MEIADFASDAYEADPESALLAQASESDIGEGDSIVSYRWDLNYDGSTFVSDVTGEIPTVTAAQLTTFGIDAAGDFPVALQVTDTFGETGMDAATLTVTEENREPVADAGADQTVGVNNVVALDGSGSSDPDGDALTYAWTLTSVPASSTAALDDSTAQKPTFTANKEGGYTVEILKSGI